MVLLDISKIVASSRRGIMDASSCRMNRLGISTRRRRKDGSRKHCWIAVRNSNRIATASKAFTAPPQDTNSIKRKQNIIKKRGGGLGKTNEWLESLRKTRGGFYYKKVYKRSGCWIVSIASPVYSSSLPCPLIFKSSTSKTRAEFAGMEAPMLRSP